MTATQNIDFIIRMQNQASSVLKNLGGDFNTVAERARAMSKDLAASTVELNALDRASTQTGEKLRGLADSMSAVSRVAATMDTSLAGSARSLTAFTGALQTAIEGRTAGITQLSRSMTTLSTAAGRLAGANVEIDRLSVSMARLSQATTSIAPVGAAFRSIRVAATNLTGSIATLDALGMAMQNVSTHTAALRAVPAAFQTMANDIRAQTAVIRGAVSSVNGLFAQGAPGANRYATELGRITVQYNNIATAAGRAAAAMRAAHGVMGQGAGRMPQAPQGPSGGFLGGLGVGVAGLTGISKGASEASVNLEHMGYAAEHASRRVTGLHEGIAGMVALFGVATGVEYLMHFSEAMAHVQAITGSTIEDLKQWEAAARYVGISTEYSSLQAAKALESIARAGIPAKDALTSLVNIMDMARLSGQSFEDVTKELVQIMGDYKVGTQDLKSVTDILAVTTKHSLANMSDMVVSFRYAGAAAAEAGLSVNETAAALAIMANGGIKASMAGTGLRQVVLDLLAPTKRAQEAFKGLGLSVEEMDVRAQETINPGRGLDVVLQKLQKSGASIKDMAAIFRISAVSAANLLVQGAGSGKMDELLKDNENAVGKAEAIGKVYTDNMQKAWERLKATMGEAWNQLGDSGVNSTLTTVLADSRAILQCWEGTVKAGDEAYDRFHGVAEAIEAVGVGIGLVLGEALVVRVAAIAMRLFSIPGAIIAITAAAWQWKDAMFAIEGQTTSIRGLFYLVENVAVDVFAYIKSLMSGLGVDFTTLGGSIATGLGNILKGTVDNVEKMVDAIVFMVDKAVQAYNYVSQSFQAIGTGQDVTSESTNAGIWDSYLKSKEKTKKDVSDAWGEALRKANEQARADVAAAEAAHKKALEELEHQRAQFAGDGRTGTQVQSGVVPGAGGMPVGDGKKAKEDETNKALDKLIPYIKKENELREAIEKSTDALTMSDEQLKKYGYTRDQIAMGIEAAKHKLDEETDSYTHHMKQLERDANLIGMVSEQRRIATAVINQFNQSLNEGIVLSKQQEEALAKGMGANQLAENKHSVEETLKSKSEEIEKEMALLRIRGDNADVMKAIYQMQFDAAKKGIELTEEQIDKYKDEMTELKDLKDQQATVAEATHTVFSNVEKAILDVSNGGRDAFAKMAAGISNDLLKSSMDKVFKDLENGANGAINALFGLKEPSKPKTAENIFHDMAKDNAQKLTEANTYLAKIAENTAATAGKSLSVGNQYAAGTEPGVISGTDAQIKAVAEAAKAHNVNPAFGVALAQIESSFKPNDKTGSYGGLMGTQAGNLLSPQGQIDAGMTHLDSDRKWFKSTYNSEPTDAQRYMMYQQGTDGYKALTSGNRNDSLKGAYDAAGINWSHIVGGNTPQSPGNLPWRSGLPRDETLTKGQFQDYLSKKVQQDTDAAAIRLAQAGDKLNTAADKIANSGNGNSQKLPNANSSGDTAPLPYVGGTGEADVEVDGHAVGGMIFGPGGPTDDAILARLSNKEYVVNADATDYYGSNILDMINNKTLPKEFLPGFASGGLVGSSVPASMGGSSGGGGGIGSASAALYGSAIDLSTAARAVNEGGGYLTQGAQLILQGGTTATPRSWQSAIPYATVSSSSSFEPKEKPVDPWRSAATSAMTLMGTKLAGKGLGMLGLGEDGDGSDSEDGSDSDSSGGSSGGGNMMSRLWDNLFGGGTGDVGQTSIAVDSPVGPSIDMQSASFSSGYNQPFIGSSSGMGGSTMTGIYDASGGLNMDVNPAAMSPGVDPIGDLINNTGMADPGFNVATDSIGADPGMFDGLGSSLGDMGGGMMGGLFQIGLSLLMKALTPKPKRTETSTTSVNWYNDTGGNIGGYTYDAKRAKEIQNGLVETASGNYTNIDSNDNVLNPTMQALTEHHGNLVWNPGPLVKNADGTIQHDSRFASWTPSFFGQDPYAPIGGSDTYEQGGSLFNYMPYTYHTGGVVGEPTSERRSSPASLWSGARRYHDGGPILGNDEVPIIAKRGERVLNMSDSALLAQSLSKPGHGLMRDDALSPQSLQGGRRQSGVNSNGYSDGNNGGHTIYMNVSTPDAQSFKKSEGQIGHEVGSAINRAQRRNG